MTYLLVTIQRFLRLWFVGRRWSSDFCDCFGGTDSGRLHQTDCALEVEAHGALSRSSGRMSQDNEISRI